MKSRNIKRTFAFLLVALFLNLVRPAAVAQTMVCRIQAPEGFKECRHDRFGSYLITRELKPKGTKVRLYDGRVKAYQEGVYAVIHMDIGKKDLQQCADAVIRLRAEYLWWNGKYDDIQFNFSNGFRADYSKWQAGYRIKVEGNKAEWYKSCGDDVSYNGFREYLDIVFAYAGTASLVREMHNIPLMEARAGDVFIHGGFPGHAMIIMNVAEDGSGRKALLVAQSYMPAQDIHIVKNLGDAASSPWYIINGETEHLVFPEWIFSKSELYRF